MLNMTRVITALTIIILILLCYEKNNHAKNNPVPYILKSKNQTNFYYNRKKKDNSVILTPLDRAKKEISEGTLKKSRLYYDITEDSSGEKTVALTFDDGPHLKYTSLLLDILKRHHVKATFFVVGSMAEKYPDLLKDIYEDGHLIANHTYHHKNLLTLSEDDAVLEWQACNNVIKYILNIDVFFCRPPGGNYDRIVLDSASRAGLSTVFWTDNSGDYEKPGEEVIEDKVLYRITPGGIVLMHDGVDQTINALPAIIRRLTENGYRFVRIDEMAHKIGENYVIADREAYIEEIPEKTGEKVSEKETYSIKEEKNFADKDGQIEENILEKKTDKGKKDNADKEIEAEEKILDKGNNAGKEAKPEKDGDTEEHVKDINEDYWDPLPMIKSRNP
ncbi:MAG: polysaccharide deacetylase family protein [Candidatus Eremiobacterota bacterium]